MDMRLGASGDDVTGEGCRIACVDNGMKSTS